MRLWFLIFYHCNEPPKSAIAHYYPRCTIHVHRPSIQRALASDRDLPVRHGPLQPLPCGATSEATQTNRSSRNWPNGISALADGGERGSGGGGPTATRLLHRTTLIGDCCDCGKRARRKPCGLHEVIKDFEHKLGPRTLLLTSCPR